jgi:hypothetical protein
MAINQLLKRMSDFYSPLQSGDLLFFAKHLFVAATATSGGHKTMAGSGRYLAAGRASVSRTAGACATLSELTKELGESDAAGACGGRKQSEMGLLSRRHLAFCKCRR